MEFSDGGVPAGERGWGGDANQLGLPEDYKAVVDTGLAEGTTEQIRTCSQIFSLALQPIYALQP